MKKIGWMRFDRACQKTKAICFFIFLVIRKGLLNPTTGLSKRLEVPYDRKANIILLFGFLLKEMKNHIMRIWKGKKELRLKKSRPKFKTWEQVKQDIIRLNKELIDDFYAPNSKKTRLIVKEISDDIIENN